MTESSTTNPTNNPPIDRLRYGPLSASIWKNEPVAEDLMPWYSVMLTRAYLNDAERWEHTTTFGIGDLLAISELTRQAHHRIHELQQEDRVRASREGQASVQQQRARA